MLGDDTFEARISRASELKAPHAVPRNGGRAPSTHPVPFNHFCFSIPARTRSEVEALVKGKTQTALIVEVSGHPFLGQEQSMTVDIAAKLPVKPINVSAPQETINDLLEFLFSSVGLCI